MARKAEQIHSPLIEYSILTYVRRLSCCCTDRAYVWAEDMDDASHSLVSRSSTHSGPHEDREQTVRACCLARCGVGPAFFHTSRNTAMSSSIQLRRDGMIKTEAMKAYNGSPLGESVIGESTIPLN
uniref:Uncharacterized protein n=1 Tax=Coccidioides posadasii RMSCC 3488 TaxID=454284 RepID=A0A0J6I4V9_COCPO|nr:hypothetical protein CPAG_02761 [Coccidioides posadasii RMSCC 3488]